MLLLHVVIVVVVLFSWIEDENITSGNIVSIIQHVWWCIDTQINFGLSDMTRKRRSCAENLQNNNLQNNRESQSFSSSAPSPIPSPSIPSSNSAAILFAPTSLGSQTSLASQTSLGSVTSAPRKSSVSRIRDAVASTSGGRLLAQILGQPQEQQSDTAMTRKDVIPSLSALAHSNIDDNQSRTDFYAEYLGLPTSCSAGDFEAQVFFLMVSQFSAKKTRNDTYGLGLYIRV